MGSCSGSGGSTSTGCSGLPQWTSAGVFQTGNETVYNGTKYIAKWYTQGQIPGDPNGPWQSEGVCTTPVLSATGSSFSFTTSVGTPSAEQTFNLSGSNLSTGVNITASSSFEISLTPGTGFSNQINLPPANGALPSTTVFIRYNPAATGTLNGTVLITNTGATTITLNLTGTASTFTYTVCNDIQNWSASQVYVQNNEVAYSGKRYIAKWYNQNQTPGNANGPWTLESTCVYSTFTVAGTLSAYSTLLGTPSGAQNLTVSGANLIADIIVSAPSQFEVSLNNTSFSSSVNLTPVNGSVASTTVYVRYNPTAVGNSAGSVIIGTTGLAKQFIAVTGTAGGTWIMKDPISMYANPTITTVAIGTLTVPTGYMMSVSGKIISKGLRVQFDNWADTVFADGYKLPNLKEVEMYVKENKHLPEFPSEKEVLKNGMAIEEMNVLLLKKVEELTLLMIEQDRKLKETQMEIEKLKKQ